MFFWQVFVDTLVKKAYDNWMHVIEYDGRALLNSKQSKRASSSRNEVQMGPVDYIPTMDQQVSLPRLQMSVPPEQASADSSLTVVGEKLLLPLKIVVLVIEGVVELMSFGKLRIITHFQFFFLFFFLSFFDLNDATLKESLALIVPCISGNKKHCIIRSQCNTNSFADECYK